MNGLLALHDKIMIKNQEKDQQLDFWRIVVPDRQEIKKHMVQELHNTSYSAHPGIQRTLGRIRKLFYWKGMVGNIRQYVESCLVVRQKNLTTEQLRVSYSPPTFQRRPTEISIDFINYLPTPSRNKYIVVVTVDKAIRVDHLAPCRKNITATATAKLLWSTRVIYSDTGAQFTANSWEELVASNRNQIKYITA